MLTIHYNGYDIPTGRDFSVRFSWVNPACYFDKIPGSAGLGIDIPVNDYSRAIFGSPHRFEKYGTGDDRKFTDVDIRFNGVLLMSGTLNITNATSEKYSCWLQSKVGDIGEEQRDKFINEMDWSEFNAQTLDNKGDFDDDTDDYCTGELINRRFWEEIGRTDEFDEDYINDEGFPDTRKVEMTVLTAAHRDNFDYKVNDTSSGIAVTTGTGCVVSAFLFLRFLLNQLFKKCSLFIDSNNNALDDLTEYKNIAVYNNYNLMEPVFVTEAVVVNEEDYLTGSNETYTYQEITSMTWSLGTFDYARLIPHIKLADFLLSLQNMLNIIFQFRNDNQVNIIDREAIITGSAYDLDEYFRGEWIIGERKNSTLKFIAEYDPDDSVISDSFHDLSERRADFGADVISRAYLDDIVSPRYGEIRYLIEEDEYWEYKWDVGVRVDSNDKASEFDRTGWVKISTGPQPVLYGTGNEVEEIKTNISAPYRKFTSGIIVMQKGTISNTRTLWNNFTGRLFFHEGNNYITTVTSVGHKSLVWDGSEGLLENRWKSWAAFWSNRLPVEGEFALPLNVLYYVINNITQKFKTTHGEFIIEEMNVEFGMNMIANAYIKGFKI